MNINPQLLIGHWKAGYALDLHTVSSKPIEWEIKKVTHPELVDGKWVTVEKEERGIPIPPSDLTREFQPVYEIITYVAELCEIPVDFEIVRKVRSTAELKAIENPAQRKQVLYGAFSIQNNSLTGKNILLFDDLYRSGETLNAVSDTIVRQGNAKTVYVLTITKTRSKR